MLFARISFVPNNDHEEAELVSAAENFLAALYRNGQIVGESVSGWFEGIFDAIVYASHRDSLHPKYYSRWVQQALTEVRAGFGADPICEIIDDNVSLPVPTLKSATSLFLYCESVSGASPVRHGNRGTPVAVPLLTITDELSDQICDWSSSYVNHDRIFFGGGPLEIAAYHQLADPFSELMSEGRWLAAAIEKTVGVAVYSYLLRHWGTQDGEENRRCPGCGGDWTTDSSPHPSREPFHRFHFRCDPCRMVSHVAATLDEPEMAEIGSFCEARRIEARPLPETLQPSSDSQVELSASAEPEVSDDVDQTVSAIDNADPKSVDSPAGN